MLAHLEALASLAVRPGLAVLVAMLGIAAVGCRAELIPNTDVEDTPENRQIVEFCEAYRKAVERRDIDKLIKLAHPRYYEDGGTLDASDDIDLAGLREYLENEFATARGIRYEIRYRRVSEGEKQRINVDYTFSASYKVPTEDGELWQRRVKENRLELVPSDEETYRIISGM